MDIRRGFHRQLDDDCEADLLRSHGFVGIVAYGALRLEGCAAVEKGCGQCLRAPDVQVGCPAKLA